MFDRLFTRPLVLTVAEKRITFNSVDDFEFAVASRVEVPGSKVSALVRLSPDALKREAQNIRSVEKSFVDVLARSLQETGTIGPLLQSLDAQNFSNDHHWRDIVTGLRQQPSAFDEYKKIALVKYMQYLAARQDVLRSVYADKRKNAGPEGPEEAEPEGEPGLRETLIFELERVPDREYSQLPRGETVEVRIERELPLVLSRHRFRLVSGESFCLRDAGGAEYPLRSGKNILGRYHGNHVVLDAGFRDVSRKHVVVEPVGRRRVRLTDLSSHGTFVPTSSLPQFARRRVSP